MNALISRSANHILLPAIGITCLALCTLLILGGMVNAPTPAGTATPLPALTDGEGDPHEEKDKEDFMLPLPWPFFADGEGDPHEEKDKEDFMLPLPWPFFADGEGDPHEEKDKEDFVLPLPWPFQTLIG